MGYNYHLDMGVDPNDGDMPELLVYTVAFEYLKSVLSVGNKGVFTRHYETTTILMNATDFDAVQVYIQTNFRTILEEYNVKSGRILVYLAVLREECITEPVLRSEYRIIDERLFEEVV